MTSKERIERIELLKRQIVLLKPKLLGVKVSADLLQQYHSVLTELTRTQRIEAGFQDVMVFAKNYFTGRPPHDLLKADTPSPLFHFELATELREAVLHPWEQKIAIAAPRSHAKSTIITNIFLLWTIAYVEDVNERYWVIIGDKQDNSRRFLDTIKSEIDDNEDFRADFGDLRGSTWNSLEIITSNDIKLSAHGLGEGLRGLRFGSYRPSVVMDDVESDESCSTADRIAKTLEWFDRTLMPLGDPKRSKFFLVGTVIHYNSLLNQVLNERSDWKAFKFQAIKQFPERMDLWDEWERKLSDRTQGANPMESSRIARQVAMAFYTENKAEMDAGSEVLWPERMDLLSLFERRAVNRLAFNSEYQNQPIDASTRLFSVIKYYNADEISIDDLDVYGAVDPSMGATKRSDPSAIITVGKHRRSGIVYVLDIDVKRRHPDVIIQDIFRKARAFNYVGFSIETTAFQAYLKDELTKRSAEQGVYLPIREFNSKVKKHVRISALEPLFTNGFIRILPTQKAFEEQLLYFPRGHDDVLDVAAQVMELAKKDGGNTLLFGKL